MTVERPASTPASSGMAIALPAVVSVAVLGGVFLAIAGHVLSSSEFTEFLAVWGLVSLVGTVLSSLEWEASRTTATSKKDSDVERSASRLPSSAFLRVTVGASGIATLTMLILCIWVVPRSCTAAGLPPPPAHRHCGRSIPGFNARDTGRPAPSASILGDPRWRGAYPATASTCLASGSRRHRGLDRSIGRRLVGMDICRANAPVQGNCRRERSDCKTRSVKVRDTPRGLHQLRSHADGLPDNSGSGRRRHTSRVRRSTGFCSGCFAAARIAGAADTATADRVPGDHEGTEPQPDGPPFCFLLVGWSQ